MRPAMQVRRAGRGGYARDAATAVVLCSLLALALSADDLVAVGGQPETRVPSTRQARPKARLFPPQDLGLLEGPDRDQWQKPELIMDALGIADGSVVADLGAGSGWFTIRLAHRVGPNGLVYAEDIQREMIEAMSRRIERERLTNVQTVLGTDRDPRLPSPVDAVLMVAVYHEVEDPVALLKNVERYLKPGGRVGVVDFTAGGGGPGPAPDERVEPDAVIRAAAAAGLQLLGRQAVPPFVYLLVFGKANSRVSP